MYVFCLWYCCNPCSVNVGILSNSISNEPHQKRKMVRCFTIINGALPSIHLAGEGRVSIWAGYSAAESARAFHVRSSYQMQSSPALSHPAPAVGDWPGMTCHDCQD